MELVFKKKFSFPKIFVFNYNNFKKKGERENTEKRNSYNT